MPDHQIHERFISIVQSNLGIILKISKIKEQLKAKTPVRPFMIVFVDSSICSF